MFYLLFCCFSDLVFEFENWFVCLLVCGLGLFFDLYDFCLLHCCWFVCGLDVGWLVGCLFVCCYGCFICWGFVLLSLVFVMIVFGLGLLGWFLLSALSICCLITNVVI